MFSKRLVLACAMLLLGAAVAIGTVGASQPTGVKVPAGAIVDSPNVHVNAGGPRPSIPNAPGLPAASSAILLSEDFSGNLDKWQTLSAASGTWVAQDGRLQQRGDERGENGDSDTVLIAKDTKFDNGLVEANTFPTSGSPVGIVFRGSDAGYYRVTLHANVPNSQPKAYLEKVTATGQLQQLASAPVSVWSGYKLAQWHNLTVNASGSRIVVSVDGVQVIQATDSAYSTGWAGVWTSTDMGAQFDNVRIQRTTIR